MNILLEGTNKKEVDMMVKTEWVNNFKITHSTPNLTKEQKEDIQKEILKKIYKIVSNKNLYIDTKVR